MRRTLFLFIILLLILSKVESQAVPAINQPTVINCTNWLSLPSYQSFAQIGDLDIPGTQVTLEAIFVRTTPYSGGYNWAGDLVSKHVDPTDVNYLLRPNNAEITTTNGFFTTPPVCEIELNKMYHAAMTYDGNTLKFYRNGFLMSSVPATGNLFQNDHNTRIGLYDANQWNTNLIGYVNEVRIWNKVRTQAEIQAYLNTPLPNPSTQTGLLAYYQFNDLTNKQGNALWNASIGGNASVNTTVSNCGYFRDSCTVIPVNISGIINNYTPVLSFGNCDNTVTVENGSAFNAGDTVMLFQMKGADMNTTNSSSFGTVTAYNNAGNYEVNYVKSRNGNVIELKNARKRQYDLPNGKVQLIRVPYYQRVVASNLTGAPWDGSKGGVLALIVEDTLELAGDIDVSGKGFKGGIDPVTNPSSFYCYENQFLYPVNPDLASGKGEGIAVYSADISFGKGSPANGGGGGNSHNSGGGGGSNAGQGGFGGYNFEGDPCTNTPFDNRGIGGKNLAYTTSSNKMFLGGGGGAGHTNNPQAFQALGGNGGGIVVIRSYYLKGNGHRIISNGNDGLACGLTDPTCHEGMGGGGGGGAIVLHVNSIIGSLLVDTKGGKGADMTADASFLKVGPGGGGGGGTLAVSALSLPPNITHNSSGGLNGVATSSGNVPFGATAGSPGTSLIGVLLPVDDIPFKKNIDSLRIRDTLLTCNSFKFNGIAYTNSSPAATYDWDLGDGNTASTQVVTHTYVIPNTYNVKLVVTDINGCKDSTQIPVTASILTTDAGPADTICQTGSTLLQGSQTGATNFSWSPATGLSNPNILNPVASPMTTTTYYLTSSNNSGCTVTDSARIEVRSFNGFSINPPLSACLNDGAQLWASGGDLYDWSPAGSLNDPTLPDPFADPASSTIYTVTITDTLCGFVRTLSTDYSVLSLPLVRASRSNDLDCATPQTLLNAAGATNYEWSPDSSLNNAFIPSPIATPAYTTQYIVKGTDRWGCVNYDSVTVRVTNENKTGYAMPTAFTPNNDGLNDCFGMKYWGQITQLEFSVYNRWGQRIFFTSSPGACWDGTFRGVPQDPAVFVYMVKANTKCAGWIFRKGTFALIR